MAIGDSGYVFIAGSFQETVQFGNDVSLTSNGWIDTFIAKYDTSGNCIWAINMGGEYDDYCYSIVLDENGNIYGTGSFGRLADFDPSDEVANLSYHGPLPLFSDAFIAKYDSNGNYLWANSLGGEITDRGWFVKVDHAKDVYVTGPFDSNIFYPNSYDTTISTNGFSDIFIAKYDSNGNILWVTNIGDPLHDEPYFMDIDDSNNFVITGSFTDSANFNSTGQEVYLYSVNNSQDVFLAKYETNGNNIWTKSFGSSSFDFGRSLGIHNNDIYLAGTFSGDITINSLGGNTLLTCGGLGDIFLTKFNSDGENIWALSIEGMENDAWHSALSFLKKARDELLKIEPIWQKRIKAKLEILAKNPAALMNSIKALKGNKYKGLARLRVGNYRIIFQKKEKDLIILIVRIAHRGDVYRK